MTALFALGVDWTVVDRVGVIVTTLAAILGIPAALVAWRRRKHVRSVVLTVETTTSAPMLAAGGSLAAPTGTAPARLHGRDRLLRQLRRAVRRPPGRVQVLAGLGGVGKSTIAVELYQWVERDEKRSAWWISASDADVLVEGLVSLARALGANHGDVEAVRSGSGAAQDRLWGLLEQARPGWLLVFDNADDPDLLGPRDGTGWLRRSERGLVLVTSRLRSADSWGNDADVHAVAELGRQDAARVLMDLAPRAGNQADARALADRLGCLPLALHVAGTYLSSTFAEWTTFAAYQQALDTVGFAELFRPYDGIGTREDPRSMLTRTWELSLKSLADHGQPQATPLLRLLSCYAATTPISVSLLYAPPIRDLVDIDHSRDDAGWRRSVNSALEGLDRLSLVTAQRTSDDAVDALTVVLHPVVAEINRVQLNSVEQSRSVPDAATIRRVAVELVTAAVEPLRFDNDQHWPAYRALVPHVSALLDSTAPHLEDDSLAKLLKVAARTVAGYAWGGSESAAEILATKALAQCGRLGSEHPACLDLRNERAWAVGKNGRSVEAEAELRQVLGARDRMLDPKDLDTLDTRHKLAWAVGKVGDWTTAENQLRAVCDARARLLGLEHPDTLHTRCCLAWAVSQNGRLAEAEAEYRDLFAVRARVLGPNHADTWDTLHSLAEAFVLHGRYVDAERQLRDIIEARPRVLGPEYPETLDSRPHFWLASALRGQGRHGEADREFSLLLADQTRTLGADHPATNATREQLRSSHLVA